MKLHAPSSERNKAPILVVLEGLLQSSFRVLEVGAGSGQHAGWFAGHMPWLTWQPSEQSGALTDLSDSLPTYRRGSAENLLAPVALDVSVRPWPVESADAIYTANTLHMMTWEQVISLFAGAAEILASSGLLLVYGPFSYAGSHISPGNAEFDRSLRGDGSGRGIRDFDDLENLAIANGFSPAEISYLPANNQLLSWKAP